MHNFVENHFVLAQCMGPDEKLKMLVDCFNAWTSAKQTLSHFIATASQFLASPFNTAKLEKHKPCCQDASRHPKRNINLAEKTGNLLRLLPLLQ